VPRTSNVAVDAPVTVVFSEAMAPASADTNSVTMAGGTITARTWTNDHTLSIQHAGFASGAHVVVTLGTGLTDAAGNHLAAARNFSFTVITLDTTAPTVTSLTPADGAADVAADAPVTVVFSEAMSPAGVDTAVTMTGGTITARTWTAADTLVVQHDAWNPGDQVTVTVGTGLFDLAGNALAAARSATFTVNNPDVTPPTVTSITPADGASDVSPNAVVTVVFSEAMDQATADSNSVTMTGGTITSLTWSDDHTLVIGHDDWTEKSMVSVTLGTGLADLAGNHLAQAVTATFGVTVPDTTPPNVLSFTPGVGATDVDPDADITVVFSEAMDQTSVTGNIALSQGTITGLAWSDDHTVVVHHDTWPGDTQITVSILSAVRDIAGNEMGHGVSWLFTTVATGDTTPPHVVDTDPEMSDQNVSLDYDVTVTFNEPMQQDAPDSSVTMDHATVTGLSWTDDHTVVVHHTPWPGDVDERVYLHDTFRDTSGNAYNDGLSWGFHTAPEVDTTPPTIVTASPADGMTGGQPVVFEFSEPVNQIDTYNALQVSNTTITQVRWENNWQRLILFHANWTVGQQVTVTLGTGTTDLAGNHLAAPYSATFTVDNVDTRDPELLRADPADGATGVAQGAVLRLYFSEDVDPGSIVTSVSLDGYQITDISVDAYLVEISHEPFQTSDTVTLHVGDVHDMAGKSLTNPQDIVINVTDTDVIPPTVDFLMPENGSSDVPANQAVVVGFTEPMNQNSAIGAITMSAGAVDSLWWADDQTLIVAHTDWPTGYMVGPVTVTIGIGLTDLAGNHLAAPVATTFTVTNADQTPPTVASFSPPDGALDVLPTADVVIEFSETVGPLDAPGLITMTGGTITELDRSGPQELTIHHDPWTTGATVTVTVSGDVYDLAGNPMGTPASATFTVGEADTIPPAVQSVTPDENATDVDPDADIVIGFTEAMDHASVSDNITLSQGMITGLDWPDDHTVVVHHGTWPILTTVNVTVSSGARDLAGNAMENDMSWQFTTSGGDTTPPGIQSFVPQDGATNVSPDTEIDIEFSEAMDQASVPGNITLSPGTVTGIEWMSDNLIIVYHETLPAGTQITVTVLSGAQDLAGNPMDHDVSWQFTTASDNQPPSLLTTTPQDGDGDVASDADVTIVFSEAMNQASTAGSISLSGGITGQNWIDDHTLVLQHAPWGDGWPITLGVDYGMTDLAGNHLTSTPHEIHFTVQGTDTTPPSVTGSDPADGATDVVLDPAMGVSIMFSEPMDEGSVLSAVGISPDGGHANYDNDTRTLHVNGSWPAGAHETISVGTAATDLVGNHLPSEFSMSLTMAGGDTTAPDVSSITPADGATDVPVDQDVIVTFSEPMDQMCAANYLQMSNDEITSLEWTDDHTVILHHASWTPGESVTVTVASGPCDLAGNVMQHPVTATFTVTSDTTPPQIVSIDPADGATPSTDTSQIEITFSEAVDPSSVTFTEINGQLFNMFSDAGIGTWSSDGTVLTMPLRSPLPAGLALHMVIGTYADLAGNPNVAPTTWNVTVAGTADEYPVDDSLIYAYGGRGADSTNPVWDGTWGYDYHEFVWDPASPDFKRLELDTPTSTSTDWDYLSKTTDYIMFRGFRENDEEGGTDYEFDPQVYYIQLPLQVGHGWSGSSRVSTPDGEAILTYHGEVLSSGNVVEIPSDLPNKNGPAKTGTRLFWDHCFAMRLYHDMVAGSDTMEVGVDTLLLAPGIGIVRESSFSTDYSDTTWSWDSDILYEVAPLTK